MGAVLFCSFKKLQTLIDDIGRTAYTCFCESSRLCWDIDKLDKLDFLFLHGRYLDSVRPLLTPEEYKETESVCHPLISVLQPN